MRYVVCQADLLILSLRESLNIILMNHVVASILYCCTSLASILDYPDNIALSAFAG